MSSAPSRPKFNPERVDVGKLFDKLPPHALEAECALLGSMILDPQVIGDVVQILAGSDDFYKPSHAAIYQALVELYDQNQNVDMVHLVGRLKDRGELEASGGLDYLLSLVESVPSAVSGPLYARLVKEKSLLRKLIDSAGRILQRAYTSSDPVEEMLDSAEQEIFQLAESKTTNEATDLNTLLQETYAKLESHDGRMVTGLETGFFELDEMTSGLQNGEVIIVAARPSMGKTALAVNMAEHIAVNTKQPVVIFSLEMSKLQLAQRLLCSRSTVDSQHLRRNMLSDDEWQKLQSAVGQLSEAPLFIDDTPGLSLLALRAKARRLAARHHIKLIVIDYLQLMSGPRADSREQEVSGISRGIKALARELNVPVICLSQLNRGPEAREGHRPRMSDLRESGSIEQDADMVLMLHREDYYHRGEEGHVDDNTAELIISKQRNGPTGTVKLHFNSATTRFGNLQGGSGGGGGGY
ncbi:MAG: replicative DNA helicase [Planctomycetota bacterium]|nr:replicative DNA helicase [Planctomycetota bacterium]